jgi:hypothetical protein
MLFLKKITVYQLLMIWYQAPMGRTGPHRANLLDTIF